MMSNFNWHKKAVLKSPVISLTDDMLLSFMLYDAASEDFTVYISTDGGATYTTELAKFTNNREWEQKFIDLSAYTGQSNVKIVFEAVSSNGGNDRNYYTYLDNIIISEMPNCAKPLNLNVSSLSDTSVTFVWQNDIYGSTTSNYRFTLRDEQGINVYNNQSFSTVNNINSYTINGLQNNSHYELLLQADCSQAALGFSEQSSIFEFHTLSNPVSLPYSVNFDGLTALPSGWHVGINNTSTSVTIVAPGYNSTTNTMAIKPNGKPVIITTPTLISPADSIEIDFFVQTTKMSNIKIGLMTDIADMSTMDLVFDTSFVSLSKWENIRVNTARTNYGKTNNVHLVIYVESADVTSIINIDEITISHLSKCPRLEHVDVLADSTSVILSWTENTISPSGNYFVRYENNDNGEVGFFGGNTNPLRVTGLDDNTNYTFRVSSICSNTDTSEYSIPVSIRTLCSPASPLFMEDFEDKLSFDPCWTTKQTVLGTGVSGNDNGATGWSVIKWSNTMVAKLMYGKAGGHYNLATHALNIDAPKKYDLRFKLYRQNASTANDYIRVWASNTTDTTNGVLLGVIGRNINLPPKELVAGWYDYEFNIPLTGSVHIIFEGVLGSGYIYSYLDEIQVVEAPLCREPKNLEVVPELNSISVSWTASEAEHDSWLVSYVIRTSDTDSTVHSEVVHSTNYVISGLNEATTYHLNLAVSTECNDTLHSTPLIFDDFISTNCRTVTTFPYEMGFENLITFPPVCWERAIVKMPVSGSNHYEDTWTYINNADVAHSGAGVAYFQPSGSNACAYISSPKFSFENDKHYQVKFWMYRDVFQAYSKVYLRLKLTDSPTDTMGTIIAQYNANIAKDPIEVSPGYYQYTVEIPDSVGEKHIMFIGQNSAYYEDSYYLDDIVVEERPACKPFQKLIGDVIDCNTVKVMLDNNTENAQDWEVAVLSPNQDIEDVQAIAVTNDDEVEVGGLTPFTDYRIVARRKCAEGVYSDWSANVCYITTPCNPVILSADSPFIETFESLEMGAEIDNNNCYDYQKTSTYFQTALVSNSVKQIHKPYSGNQCVTFFCESYLFREFYLEAGKTYEVSAYAVANNINNNPNGDRISFALATSPDMNDILTTIMPNQLVPDQWTRYAATLTVSSTGNYYICVHPYSFSYLGLDNWSVREIDCTAPANIYINSTTTNSGELVFTPTADRTEIRVSLNNNGDLDPDFDILIDTLGTSENNVLISGLEANNKYYYTLRSLCGENKQSSWSPIKYFYTLCEAITVPYNENFEEATSLFSCWNTLGVNNTVAELSTEQSHSLGKSSLKLENTTIVTPEFNVTSLADYSITGYVYLDATTGGNISIGVMINPSMLETYEPIADITIPSGQTWVEFSTDFSVLNSADYQGDDLQFAKYIAIASGDNVIYLDDIKVLETPSCIKPNNLTVRNFDPRSLNVEWTAGGNETSYEVTAYRITDAENYGKEFIIDYCDTVTSTSVVINTLSPSSTYTISVVSLCGNNEHSLPVYSVEFETECSPLTLPYIDKFKEYSNQRLFPPCWTQGDYYPAFTANVWISQPNSCLMWRYTTDSIPAYSQLLSPIFDMTSVLNAKIEMSLATVNVDTIYVTASYDGGLTFTDTIGKLDRIVGSADQSIVLDAQKCVGKNVMFAITARSFNTTTTSVTSNVSLLSFHIEPIQVCQIPINVIVGAVTATSATVVINDTVATHNTWEYAVVLSGRNIETSDIKTVNNVVFSVEGLVPATYYDLYVRSSCGSEKSYWRGPISFLTTCEIANAPYYEDFEDDIDCYEIFMGSSDMRMDKSLTAPYQGIWSMYFASSSINTSGFMVLPRITMPLTSLALDFKYMQQDGSGMLVVGIMNGTNEASFIPLDTCNNVGVTSYTDYRLTFEKLSKNYDNYRIAIQFIQGDRVSRYSTIDNISIKENILTPTVENVEIISITSTQATFLLEYEPDSVEVCCVLRGNNPLESGNTIFTTDTVVINSLQAGSSYSLYARTRNEYGISEWFGPFDFNSGCNVISLSSGNPWLETFDNNISGNSNIPACIEALISEDIDNVNFPRVLNSTLCNHSGALSMKGNNRILLPVFNVMPSNTILSFYIIGNGCDVFIGTMKDQDMSSYNQVDFITTTSSVTKIVLDLSTYYCAGNRVAISTTDASSIIYIDSLQVAYNDANYAPVISSAAVYDVKANFAWNAVASAVSSDYVCKQNGVEVASGSVVNNKAVLTGLTPNTDYVFEVRSVDGQNNTSAWTTYAFTTKYGILHVPFVIDFEDASEAGAWSYHSSSTDNFTIGSASAAVYSGNKALYISKYPESSKTYDYSKKQYSAYAVRDIYLNSGVYTVNYRYNVKGATTDFGRFFLLPEGKQMPVDVLNASLPESAISLDNNTILSEKPLYSNKELRVTVDKEGIYQMIVYWRSAGSALYMPPLAIDDISFDYIPCSLIDNVRSTSNSNSATVTFDGYNEGTTINYYLMQGYDTVQTGNIQSDVIALTGLNANTAYTITFNASCDEGSTSFITHSFSTLCNSIMAPYRNGFEEVSNDVAFADTYDCWSETPSPFYYKFKGTAGVASQYTLTHHTGSQSLYYQSGANSVDILQNIYHMDAGKIYTLSIYAYHAEPLNVGNTLTFVLYKDGKQYKNLATFNLNSDWKKYSVDMFMEETGDYEIGIRIKHTTNASGATRRTLFTVIDDLEFIECESITPTPIEVVSLIDNEVSLQWSNVADTFLLALELNGQVVMDTLLETNNCVINHLLPNTTYNVYVSGIIDGDTTDAATATFTSGCGAMVMPYVQDFTKVDNGFLPTCWDNTTKSVLVEGSDNWTVSTISGNKVLSVNTKNVEGLALIETMPILISGENTALSFKYFNKSTADKLYVVASDGAVQDTLFIEGVTDAWKQTQCLLNEFIGKEISFKFSTVASLMSSGNDIFIDDVRITNFVIVEDRYDSICEGEPYLKNGFKLTASDVNLGENNLHSIKYGLGDYPVDSLINVHLYVNPKYKMAIYDTICNGDVYNKGLFANVNPPITKSGRYEIPFISSAGCDSIVALYLNVINLDSTINATICEGDSYVFNGTSYTEDGIYTINETNSNGCEVFTTINLVVMPQYYESNIMRCDSELYQWEDTVITTTGTYFRYYQNSLGCDSIIKLNYTAVPSAIYDTVTVCSNGSYNFVGEVLTEEGTYPHTFTSTLGCDSTVYLTLYKAPVIRNVLSDYVCEGDQYNGHGFSVDNIVNDTIIERTMQTVEGCDSIIEVHVSVIPAVYDTIYASINEGDYYEFGGNTYTQAGEYSKNFFSENGCDSIVTLFLTVVTGVEGTYTLPITVAPNPIRGGETTYIVKEWSAEEQQGLVVEMFNSLGQKLSSFRPAVYPIIISDLNVSGVYYIRIIDGTGNIYTGKLIVK